MCQLKKYHKTSNTQIDECMRVFISNLSNVIGNGFKIVACCCGHGKYPMTVIIKQQEQFTTNFYDLISGEGISRRRNFYKKDKQGYYYIPEVLKTK